MIYYRIEKSKKFWDACLHDERLTFKNLGLLLWLLSEPEEWDHTQQGLLELRTEGRDLIKSGIRDLQELRYLTKERQRDKNGRWGSTTYVIHDVPQSEAVVETRKTVETRPAIPVPPKPTEGLQEEEAANEQMTKNTFGQDLKVWPENFDIDNHKHASSRRDSEVPDRQPPVSKNQDPLPKEWDFSEEFPSEDEPLELSKDLMEKGKGFLSKGKNWWKNLIND